MKSGTHLGSFVLTASIHAALNLCTLEARAAEVALFDLTAIRDASTLETKLLQDWRPWMPGSCKHSRNGTAEGPTPA